MISGTIAGISSFTVYPLGEITILRPSYYISYTPSSASGTMWIKSNSTATPVSYQISSYSGMLKFSNNYTQYLSFESCTWSSIETNIPMFNESLAFARCSTLQNADLYNCTSLSLRTFQDCSSLSQVSLPVCGYIGYGAFYNCYNLRSINLPVCSYISGYAFIYCYSLSQVSLPVCEYIGEVVFYDCSSLTQIDLPMCSSIGTSAFDRCSSLSQVSLPLCSYIGWGGFAYCSSLSQINLPVCSYINNFAFASCYSLTQVSLPVCSYIGRYAFNSCSSLSIITIGYSGVCSLDSEAFYNTQISSSTGRIYVPASLVSAYKSASNWSQYSAIIRPIY